MFIVNWKKKQEKVLKFHMNNYTWDKHLPLLSVALKRAPHPKALNLIKHRGRLLEEIRQSSDQKNH